MKPVLFIICLFSSLGLIHAQNGQFSQLSGSYLGQNPPGDVPEIFAHDIVSTSMYNHSSISMSPNGDEIYWAMAPIDHAKQIYYSKNVNGVWTSPEIVSFTLTEDGDCPVLSYDGHRMYFNSNRPIGDENFKRERIWCVERIQGEWARPYPLPPVINGPHLHWQVSVDRHGHLYFGSEREGSKGRDDIFMAEFDRGTYNIPISLGENINTTEHESTPYVAPNGEYLIFCRNGLRISYKDQNGQWTKSVSLGEAFDGICPYVSPDGKYLFFLKMGMGYNDIYWCSAKLIEDLKQKLLLNTEAP